VLAKALTPTRRILLEALLAKGRSLSELEVLTGKRKPTLLKHLAFLEESGVVKKEAVTTAVGKETRYSLRPYTLFLHIDPEKGAFVRLETPDAVHLPLLLVEQIPQEEFRADVRRYVRHLAAACRDWPRQPAVIVFGSVARGEGTWKSDIDAVVLVPRQRGATATLRRSLAEAANEAKHILKPHFLGVKEFLVGEPDVVQEAKEEGMLVWGDLAGDREIWRELKRYRSITS
jgi:predicted nucleotidyltransferase